MHRDGVTAILTLQNASCCQETFLLQGISPFHPMLKFSCLHLAPYIKPYLFHLAQTVETQKLWWNVTNTCLLK